MFTKKDLIKLIIPLIIEQVLGAAIGIVGTLMVSAAGEAAVSGVSLVDSINLLLLTVFSALATGGAIVSSQYLGREDKQHANLAAKQLLLVTVLLSLFIMAVCLPGNEFILRLIFGTVDADVMQNAKDYFIPSAFSYPFIAGYNACAALFRSMNNSKTPMFTSALMNVVNIGLNAVFIYALHMGAFGAALASLFSRMLGAVVLFVLLLRHSHIISLSPFFPLRFDIAMIKKILTIGIPTGLENGLFSLGKILVQGTVTSFGTAAIAANAVTGSITQLAMTPGSAVGLATIVVVGRCIGAGDYKQAGRYTIKLTLLSQCILAVLHSLMLLCMNPILSLYNMTPETAELTGQLYICANVIGILFWSFSFTLPNGLRASNDVKFTMVVSIASMWALRLGLGYALSVWLGFGVLGIWIGVGADWMIRAIFFTARYVSGRWKNRQII